MTHDRKRKVSRESLLILPKRTIARLIPFAIWFLRFTRLSDIRCEAGAAEDIGLTISGQPREKQLALESNENDRDGVTG